MSEADPISILFVSSGSRGDRLLFRYPYKSEDSKMGVLKSPGTNPYAVRCTEDTCIKSVFTSINSSTLVGYSEEVLANLLVGKPDQCGRKFEVKVNDVLFVGHPMLLTGAKTKAAQPSPKRGRASLISFNIVFALATNADEYLVASYHSLARQLAVALQHEERRCGYVHEQKDKMSAVREDVNTRPEDSLESPYLIMLKECRLAKQLKSIYHNLCNNGVVQIYINHWIQVNFCLPHKVHNKQLTCSATRRIQPAMIDRCITSLRPYHGMLLIVDEESLLESLPPDSSPCLVRLVQMSSPLKNLQNLALDTDMSLGQIFQLVAHLIYWGKATAIYPLCETNVYVITPNTNMFVNSALVEKFVDLFPGMSLPAVISEFSLPTPLSEHRDVLGHPHLQAQQIKMVVWMLQHHLLVQLHTYVYLMPASQPTSQPASQPTSQPTSQPASQPASQSASQPTSLPSPRDGSPDNTHSFPANTGKVRTEAAGEEGKERPAEVGGGAAGLNASCWDRLSAAERASILEVPAASQPDDLQLFLRLCAYFNGQRHLEEIMYYKNLQRSQLLTLLDKFRDVLVMCQHEDVGITPWLHDDA